MALIKACEEPTVTGDKFHWELSYKNEGAAQSQLLPDEIEGLNSEEVAKMDGGEKDIFYMPLPIFTSESCQDGWPGLLIYWELALMSRLTGSI